MYLIFSVFSSRLTSLLASNTFFCVFGIYVSNQYISIVSRDKDLVYSIQFQSFLIYLDLSEDIF
jgi:hypothetical protein